MGLGNIRIAIFCQILYLMNFSCISASILIALFLIILEIPHKNLHQDTRGDG
jgi:hypothetical protein